MHPPTRETSEFPVPLSSRSLRPRFVIAILLTLATATCTERTPVGTSLTSDSGPSALAQPAASLTCNAGNGGITLPPGFCAIVVADQVGLARHIAVRPNGDLYVALRAVPNGSDKGGILALRDRDGNGTADRKQRFGTLGGTGIAWFQGALYFAADDRVLRYTISGGSLTPSSAPATIVSGLPTAVEHKAKNITFSTSHMYVNIASGSNSCQVAEPSPGVPRGRTHVPSFRPGQACGATIPPAPDSCRRPGCDTPPGCGTCWRSRSTPGTGVLYGVQHDRDLLGMNWPKLFTMAEDAAIPSEELVRIDQGNDYGWPYCHHDRLQGKKCSPPSMAATAR